MADTFSTRVKNGILQQIKHKSFFKFRQIYCTMINQYLMTRKIIKTCKNRGNKPVYLKILVEEGP